MKLVKNLIIVFAALFALMGMAFASPISVSGVNIQEINGQYMVTVSLDNANVASGVYTELNFAIDKLGTSKTIEGVKIDSNQTTSLTYNLKDLTNSYELLKKGNTYRLTVSSSDATGSVSKSFLFGNEKTTDGLGLILENVQVNSENIDGDVLSVMNGQNITVKLRFTAQESFNNARIMAFIEGYEHSTIIDSSKIFSVVKGKTYVKTLTLKLPADMKSQQDYKLRIAGANDLSGITYKDYSLYINTQRDRVDVEDLVMTPSSGVEAGQNIIANVRMKNRGQQNQGSVKVLVEIPQLNVKESSYVSNLNSNEVATSDDMLLYIPENAKAGQYNVLVTLSYDAGYKNSTQKYTLNVLAPKTVQEKNLIVSLANNVDLTAGTAKTFNVVIANPNTESKPISIASNGNAWADVSVSPSLAMVKAGDSQTFTVTVTPKSAVAGDKELTLSVKEGANLVSDVKVSTYVAPNSNNNINWVNVSLAVLLIVAIIVLLALVIAIAKRKNGNDEDEESSEEYY